MMSGLGHGCLPELNNNCEGSSVAASQLGIYKCLQVGILGYGKRGKAYQLT